MPLSNIKAEIKVELEKITDIGVVHARERFSKNMQKFLELYQPAGKNYIRGWSISRNKTPEDDKKGAHQYRRFHNIIIRGYFVFNDDDASEDTFDSFVELVCDKFRGNRTLNNKADWVQPPQVETAEPRMFGNVLCHYAEISIVVEEEYVV